MLAPAQALAPSPAAGRGILPCRARAAPASSTRRQTDTVRNCPPRQRLHVVAPVSVFFSSPTSSTPCLLSTTELLSPTSWTPCPVHLLPNYCRPTRTRGSTRAAARAEVSVAGDATLEQQRPASLVQRLSRLRSELALACQGQGVDAFVAPAEDAHQCEYRAPCFDRMKYISGFTGSAGTAVVTKEEALLWTDGRYFLQARQQLPEEWQLMKAGLPGVPSVAEWLADKLPAGSRVAIDPFLHTAEAERQMRDSLEAKGCSLVYVPRNLVDIVWGKERPAEPLGELWVHPLKFSGRSVQEKVASIQSQMREAGASLLVTSLLDEVAWLLNVRGRDVPHCPVAISYAAVSESGAHLFIDRRKLTPEVEQHLAEAKVDIQPYTSLLPFIATAADQGKAVWMDPSKVSAALFAAFYGTLDLTPEEPQEHEGAGKRKKVPEAQQKKKAKHKGQDKKGGKKHKEMSSEAKAVEGAAAAAEEGGPEWAGPHLVTLRCPITLEKACKNGAEIEGMKRAHLRDGAALARFWAWLEGEVVRQGRAVSEVEAVEQLEKFRAQEDGFVETSFDTIAGANSNGAIIHYKPEPETCGQIGSDTLLLLDSGGQYVDGTTDVTRTAHLGTPTAYQKAAFTRVLQGHIALDKVVFPEGTPGFVLDILARKSLWEAGLDYRHGTGHGVGACLNVHEGPQSISPRFGNPTPLQPGMVLSNEPGYYDDGRFGIRIENLLVVREEPTEHRFGGSTFFGFDRLTICPIQARLIDMSLMSEEDVEWVDTYHAEVWDKLSPRLDGEALEWLRRNTLPLKGAASPSAADPEGALVATAEPAVK